MFGLFLLACNGGELKAFPSSLSWGEVDFRQSMPEDGYNPQALDINNTGKGPVDLELKYYDDEHLCLQGFSSYPESLGTLEEGESYNLVVGVCNYIEEEGERGQEITGEIEISHSGNNSPTLISWSFTPVFILE